MKRKTQVASFLVIIGVSTAAGSAIAGSGPLAPSDNEVTQFAQLQSTTPLTASDLKGNAASVWSRARTAADTPAVEVLGTAALERGGSPKDSRLIRTVNGTKVYVTPVKGGVCLSSDTYVVSTCLPKSAIPTSTGEGALSIQGLSCSPYVDNSKLVFSGLVATGVSEVRFGYSDGSVQKVPVIDGFLLNVVPRSGPLVKTLSWTDSSGKEHSVPSPLPGDAANDKCVETNPAAAVKDEKSTVLSEVTAGRVSAG